MNINSLGNQSIYLNTNQKNTTPTKTDINSSSEEPLLSQNNTQGSENILDEQSPGFLKFVSEQEGVEKEQTSENKNDAAKPEAKTPSEQNFFLTSRSLQMDDIVPTPKTPEKATSEVSENKVEEQENKAPEKAKKEVTIASGVVDGTKWTKEVMSALDFSNPVGAVISIGAAPLVGLVGVGTMVGGLVKGVAVTAYNTTKDIIKGTYDTAKDVVKGTVDTVKTLGKGLYDTGKTVVEGTIQVGKDIASGVKDGAKWTKSVVSKLVDYSNFRAGAISTLWLPITGVAAAGAFIGGVAKGIGKGIATAAKTVGKTVASAVKTVGKTVASVAKTVGKAIGGAVKTVGKAIGKIFKGW